MPGVFRWACVLLAPAAGIEATVEFVGGWNDSISELESNDGDCVFARAKADAPAIWLSSSGFRIVIVCTVRTYRDHRAGPAGRPNVVVVRRTRAHT
jgi:hypothetical protein